MKRETTLPQMRNITCGLALIAACAIIQFSCQKPANSDVTAKDDLTETAALVKGTVLYGSITSESDADALNLAYNSGRKYIILQKLAGGPDLSVNIPSAGVILSQYGVIIKDLNKNSYFLFANNDPISIGQFKSVESQVSGSVQNSLIFGSTIVNNDRE
jgi:hypothetical protein